MNNQMYIGVKILRSATLMTKEEYNTIRGWDVPLDEDSKEEVYLVEYAPDGVNGTNHPDYEGYISMSPKDIFEKAYRPINGMTWGLATEASIKGHKISNKGWNGKGMYFTYMPGYPDGIEVNEVTQKAHNLPKGTILKYRPYFQLYTAQGDVAMWNPSTSDLLSEDWYIVE